jgi:predicted transcriptional regulator
MNEKETLPQPTKAELEILQALWRSGPSTVRQVLEALSRERKAGYTTILKLLQIMTEKGLVERDESQRTHVYAAKFTQVRIQNRLVVDLLNRAFGGSARQLVMRVLATSKTSSEELASAELVTLGPSIH